MASSFLPFNTGLAGPTGAFSKRSTAIVHSASRAASAPVELDRVTYEREIEALTLVRAGRSCIQNLSFCFLCIAELELLAIRPLPSANRCEAATQRRGMFSKPTVLDCYPKTSESIEGGL